MPLSHADALEAMTGPAAVENPAFRARAFRYEPGASEAILHFLSRQHTRIGPEKPPQVEPFHLQLICRRVEEAVIARQLLEAEGIEVKLKDLGGEGNLATILRDFYEQEIGRIPTRRIRNAARRLCGDTR